MNNKVTYRQQFTRCGKQRCRKCKEGAGHGPYWYAYWSENGRTISKYIGIHLPSDLELTTNEAPNGPVSIEEAEENFVSSTGTTSTYAHTQNGEITSTPMIDAPPVQRLSGPLPGNAVGRNPTLRIYLLGQFRIERRSGDEWQTVTNRKWHRRRARALLGCLLSTASRRLGREQAMEALWPDLDRETAANRLNGAVHEARQVLEPEITRPAASRMLRLERDVLILADASQIWVDAEAFESLLNKANVTTDPEQVEQLLEEASKLYGGDYLLEELYSEWASPRRESLRRGWMGLLLKLAELRAARNALTRAIEPLDRLLTTDPTHETAVRRLMVILTQLDRRGEALRAYRRLADTLARDYDSDPLPETTALYEALRQGMYQVPRPAETPAPPAEAKAPVATPSQSIATTSQKGEVAQAGFKRPALQLGRHNQSKLVGRERELDTIQQFLLALERAPSNEMTGAGYTSGDIQDNSSPPTRSARGKKLTHFLLLIGESGIGKTRLAEELSYEANLRGWSVVWAHAYEQEGTIPYRPWTDILRTLLKDVPPEFLLTGLETQVISMPGDDSSEADKYSSTAHARLARLSTLVPELAAQAAYNAASSRLTSTLPAEQERLHLWEATSALLAVLSHSTPLLLVLDDLHWTDDSSLELLAYVVRHMQNERIALVATCRDMELAPTSNLRTLLNDLRREQALITLPVLPLDEKHIGSLVAHLPENIVQSIQSQAGGNPFFAEELARVSESGVSALPASGEGIAQGIPNTAIEKEALAAPMTTGKLSSMPDTITAVLDRRLSRLSNDCQTLLGKVAVLGGSFEFSQLSFMAGDYGNNEDTMLDLLEEALRAGLLAEEGTGTQITYHFWHPLIVSHLYERLSAARRAQLHRRAANALIQAYLGNEAEVAADITHHLSKGGSDPSQIARYAEMAGNRAFSLSAYSEAEHYYRQAIEAISRIHESNSPEDPLHLASLLERVAECSKIHGNYEEIRHLYERVLELRNQQRPDRPEDMHSEEGYLWRQQEAQRQALIWREIGRAWAETGNFDQTWQCYQYGKQVMLDAGVTSGPAWACLHLAHGTIYWSMGNNVEARRYGQEALAMLEQVIEQQGKATPPITSSELPTLTALEMIGDPLELGRCHELLGIVAATLGEHTEALEHLNRALSIFERHDQVIALTMIYGNLGAVYVMKTEYDTARMFYQRAYAMARSNNDVPNMAFVSGNLGDVAARCGNLREAEEWFWQCLSLAERINEREQMSWVHVVLAGTLQDQGDMSGALLHIRHALAIGRAIKSVLCTGFALVTLAEWRIARAMEVCKIHFVHVDANAILQTEGCSQLLARAKLAARRALTLEGLNTEVVLEGQLSLANAHFLLGEIEEAQEMTLQSMRTAQKQELTRTFARAQRLLGRLLAAQGQSEEADVYFEQALDTFSRYEMRLDYARTLHGYAVTLLQRSSAGEPAYQRGLDYLLEALHIFKECRASIDIEWVERILANPAYENVQV